MVSSTQLARMIAAVSVCAAVTSCALPPGQAWRKIKQDGLISYINYEIKTDRPTSPASSKPGSAPKLNNPAPTSQAPVVVLNQTAPNSPTKTTIQPQSLQTLTAHAVPSLPGYVRSPYTNPPRLVDVQGAVPGSTMICPYSHRPFIIPGNIATDSNSALAQNNKPAPAPKTEVPSSNSNNKPSTPSVASNTTPAPDKPKTTSAPSTPTTAPAPNLAPAPVQEIPYGDAIAGRPGFVNSPYAAKHQLVDVTGLPVGMEVKCPYTGKLFRVPSQDVATSKPTEPSTLSSPEQPAKK